MQHREVMPRKAEVIAAVSHAMRCPRDVREGQAKAIMRVGPWVGSGRLNLVSLLIFDDG